MMQVRNTTDLAQQPKLGERVHRLFDVFVPLETLSVASRAMALFLVTVGAVFGGGLVTAQATRDAAPGNSFYQVKLVVEKTQLLLAPNDDYRTRLHADFADRRIDEIAKLAESSATRQEMIAPVLDGFSREVVALKDGLEKLRHENPEGVSETAKLLERKMAVYQSVLRKAGHVLPSSSHRSFVAARNLVDDVTIAAMAVLVEKHLAGDVNTPQNVMTSKFEAQLAQAEAKIEIAAASDGDMVAPKANQAKAAIAAAKNLVEQRDYQAALTKIVEVAELTKEVEDAADAAAQEAVEECEGEDCPETNDENQEEEPASTGSADAPASEDAVGSGNR